MILNICFFCLRSHPYYFFLTAFSIFPEKHRSLHFSFLFKASLSLSLCSVSSGAGALQVFRKEEANFWCGGRWTQRCKHQQGQKQAVGDGTKIRSWTCRHSAIFKLNGSAPKSDCAIVASWFMWFLPMWALVQPRGFSVGSRMTTAAAADQCRRCF